MQQNLSEQNIMFRKKSLTVNISFTIKTVFKAGRFYTSWLGYLDKKFIIGPCGYRHTKVGGKSACIMLTLYQTREWVTLLLMAPKK